MDRKYFIASLFLIIAVVVAVVLVYPKYQAMGSLLGAIEEKQKEFTSQVALVQDISRLKSQHNEVKDEFNRVSALIPVADEQSVADLFVELEGLTSRNGVLLESISFAQGKALAKEKEKRYHTISTILSIKGSYQSIKNFMRTIETSEHLMDVVSIAITAPAQEKEGEEKKEGEPVVVAQQVLTVKAEINAYYQ